MVKVDGSVFLSGPSNDLLWVSDFYIDVCPVTNSQYAQFLTATGRQAPLRWTDENVEKYGDHPRGLRDLEWRGCVRGMVG